MSEWLGLTDKQVDAVCRGAAEWGTSHDIEDVSSWYLIDGETVESIRALLDPICIESNVALVVLQMLSGGLVSISAERAVES